MKFLILFLFPVFLQAQGYRLDSTRYTSMYEFIMERYVYTTPKDFTVYHTGYHTSGTIYNDFRTYQDSLLVLWTIIEEEGDTLFWKYSYDDLDRLVSELDYREDTLLTADLYTYLGNTDKLLTREYFSIRGMDTVSHNFNFFEYDDDQRAIYASSRMLRYDTLYRSSEAFSSYPDDSTSYILTYSTQPDGTIDTFLKKQIQYPDQYFGDTLRESHDLFDLALDSSIIMADNETSFTWGDFYQYQDAGDWTYLHGIIYGNYQDYEPTAEGYSFTFYESPWEEASPEDWREDIMYHVNIFATGTITTNDAGLPVLQKIHWLENNADAQTEYFYTQINGTDDIQVEPNKNSYCRIINQLIPEFIYYDLSGRRVNQLSGNQYLLEKSKDHINRVLYLTR